MNRGAKVKLLITYDVNTETAAGRKRLRQVAKACQDYGQRVQNSVFECVADAGMALKIKDRLIKIIDMETDSLRFYMLGDERKAKAEHYGVKPSYDVNEPMIL
jgi:CRISPR-associated protein Cas2